MEFFAQLLSLIFSFFVWLFFETFFAVCQAVAGILHPTRNKVMARHQRLALLFLLPGITLLVAGTCASMFFGKGVLALWLLGLSVAPSFVAGFFGYLAEAEFKRTGAT